MKARITFLAVCVALAAIPAMAQTIYSSGPTNGNWYAWTINFGYAVSDSFNVPRGEGGGATITGANFAMWLFPGDTLTSADLSITSSEFGGTSYFNQTVRFTQSGCVTNNYGYNLCQEATSFNVALNAGSYWLNLQNASVPSGDLVYWDQNIGPRPDMDSASENQLGTIPAETFTVLGFSTTTTITCAGAGCEQSQSVPGRSSLVLLGSGCMTLFGFLGALWRKLF